MYSGLCFKGKFHAVAEDTHWAPFINATVRYIRKNKAKEYLQKALLIRTEIGDRKGVAAAYGNLGTVFESLGQYDKAKEYLQKALLIRTEIGDREGEASCYGNLGDVFLLLGQYDKAKEYLFMLRSWVELEVYQT